MFTRGRLGGYVCLQECLIKSFLKYMALWFEIVRFTRSSKRRADCFVEKIDRNNHISFKIYEETSATRNKETNKLNTCQFLSALAIQCDPDQTLRVSQILHRAQRPRLFITESKRCGRRSPKNFM